MIEWYDFHKMDYLTCLKQQMTLHALSLEDQLPRAAFVEHPDVLTLGKHASRDFVCETGHSFLVETDRGGEVTAHEYGQLVAYVFFPVSKWKLSPKGLVQMIESSVIDVLQDYGVDAHSESSLPGIWVGHDKVCALGIRIKNRVSYHGFALNVNNSLGMFQHIVPCGIQNRGVTSLKKLLGYEIDTVELKNSIRADLDRKTRSLVQPGNPGK